MSAEERRDEAATDEDEDIRSSIVSAAKIDENYDDGDDDDSVTDVVEAIADLAGPTIDAVEEEKSTTLESDSGPASVADSLSTPKGKSGRQQRPLLTLEELRRDYKDSECNVSGGECDISTLANQYTCGYFITRDSSGKRYIEDVRMPVSCLAHHWIKFGVSPHTGREIIGVDYDDVTCRLLDVAPHIEIGEQKQLTSAIPTGASFRVGRAELIGSLINGYTGDSRESMRRTLSQLSFAELCRYARNEMSRRYYELVDDIKDWSKGVENSLSDDELKAIIDHLGMGIDLSVYDLENANVRQEVALKILARISSMEPKGFAKWSQWFKQVLRKRGSHVLHLADRHRGKIALVVLTSLCLLGGCTALVGSATNLLGTGIINATSTAYNVASEISEASEYAGHIAAIPEYISKAKDYFSGSSVTPDSALDEESKQPSLSRRKYLSSRRISREDVTNKDENNESMSRSRRPKMSRSFSRSSLSRTRQTNTPALYRSLSH